MGAGNGPGGVTCCTSVANCNTNGWYCNANNVNIRESRSHSCSSYTCSYSVTSSEDCSTKASIFFSGSAGNTVQGTVRDYTGCTQATASSGCNYADNTDTCQSATSLTEYSLNGAGVSSSTIDCNSYDTNSCWCSVSGTSLNRNCDDWNCGAGKCQDSSSDWTQSSWACSSSNQCASSASPCTGFKCYRTNAGAWTWAGSAEASESNCNDGFDNDCDGYTDAADSNCPCTLQLTPITAAPSSSVSTTLAQTYSSASVVIKDWRGCSDATALTMCSFTGATPSTSCQLTAPSNSGYTYGYWACIGQNSCSATLTVSGSHCSAGSTHAAQDTANPAKYRHYYTTAWSIEDCDWLDTYNCRNICNTGTGDIDNTCDNYYCSGGADTGSCTDSGSDWTRTSNVQDCSDTCSGETSVSYQTSDANLVDYELCSSGWSSCPSATKHDFCNVDTLTEYYCSGADSVFVTKNCNDYDGLYCNGNTRENRYYSCLDPSTTGARCNPTVAYSEDCLTKSSVDSDASDPNPDKNKVGGTVTDYTTCNTANPSLECVSTTQTDSCTGTTLTEYAASGASFTSSTKNCQDYETNYCSLNRYYRQEWGCSGTPGACNDAAVADTTTAGTNADGDSCDRECGDSLCDNVAGICDSTKTASETNCNDGIDSDCDGAKDCADADCAGKIGPNSVTCCQSAANCNSDGNYCNSAINENRDYNCVSNACTYSVTSSVDCSTLATTDTDNSPTAYTSIPAGIVTNYLTCLAGSCITNTYTDTCVSETLLNEYGKSCATYFLNNQPPQNNAPPKNCNDYDTQNCWCSVSGTSLNSICDNWNCGAGKCQDSGSDWTQNTQSCTPTFSCTTYGVNTYCTSNTPPSNQCQPSSSPCIGLKCYSTNAGVWTWAGSAEATETACSDGANNDCDLYYDLADANCAFTLTLNPGITPGIASPSSTVTAKISQSYSGGSVLVRDYRGCGYTGPDGIICTIPARGEYCTFTAPSNSAYTYGYYACVGENSASAALIVSGSHCSLGANHAEGDHTVTAEFKHYYNQPTQKWLSEDCDNYDYSFCRNTCNTGTGDIDNTCDNYYCSGGADTGGCVDSLSDFTNIAAVVGSPQDCSDTCSNDDGTSAETSASYQTSDKNLIDKELCSLGQSSCPSTPKHDSCSGDTLTDYYCSGADTTSSTTACSSAYDGWYCSVSGNTREYRDFSCFDPATTGAYCKPTVTSFEECLAKLSIDTDGSSSAYTVGGTTTDYTTCGSAVFDGVPSSWCNYIQKSDSCPTATTLIEYGASGADYTATLPPNTKNCEDYETNYCSANRYYRQEWGCSGTPGFCNDIGFVDTLAEFDPDGDGVDKSCEDGSSYNTPGVCDTAVPEKCVAKTPTETICDDSLDNDADGAKNCADSDCATKTGPNGVTCCQTPANCNSDGNYCNNAINEYRDYNCVSNACTYGVTSSDDCSTKASTDLPDGGAIFTTTSTVTDYLTCSGGSCTSNTYTDACSSATVLTEYEALGASYRNPPQTYDCNLKDLDNCWCSVSSSTLNRNCDDWNCGSGACRDSSSDWTQNTQSCSVSNQCSSSSSSCTGYKCYRTNAGAWNWAASAETTETACSDGANNDCDSYYDIADANCASSFTLSLSPNPVPPSSTVTATISQPYSGGSILIKDYLGCSNPAALTMCTITAGSTSCTLTAPSNSGYTYGYYSCLGENSASATLTVSGSHCSAGSTHAAQDTANPAKYRHYYTTAWSIEDCDWLDTYNCRNICNTGTGDIDNTCDNYYCSGGADTGSCTDSGSDWTRTSNVQDCSDTCGNSDGSPLSLDQKWDSFQVSDGDLTDYELCSAGQSSCPSTQKHDSCSADASTLTEYSCSGADSTSATYNCNNDDNWYCKGSIKEYRDFSCLDPATTGAYCNPTITQSIDCAAKDSVDSDASDPNPDKNKVGGTVTDYITCFNLVPSLECVSTQYTDSCTGTTLTEYAASGASFTSSTKNCQDYETNYCSSDRYYRQEWGCSGTPGFCNDAAAADTAAGTNADGDAKDRECGDSLCDNAAGVYDSTKTATESACADSLDNDCDGLKDCADPDCAGIAGSGGATCCQTAANCAQDDCVVESCSGNVCAFSNRNTCDAAECAADKYCNAPGGDCKTPDESESVCLSCVQDNTVGYKWDWFIKKFEDAGIGFSKNTIVEDTLFNSDGGACPGSSCSKTGGCSCYDLNKNPVNRLPPLSTGGCCGDDANEFYKRDYYGGECVSSLNICVWSDGSAQPANSGNAQWWCNPGDWYECSDSTIGQTNPPANVCCAGVVGNNAWTPSQLVLPENQYSCIDGKDNDCDGLIDCADTDCDGSVAGVVKNQDDQPVLLADVSVKKGLTTVKSATTSQQGSYSIDPISCGTYDVVASHSDYTPRTKTNVAVNSGQQTIVNFEGSSALVSGTSCEQDCTFAADNIIHASCDGKNGCAFYDSTAKAACDNSQPGWVRDYNSSHYVVCASGSPQPKVEIQASITCESGTLVKVTRIVVYNGKPVKLVVATCG